MQGDHPAIIPLLFFASSHGMKRSEGKTRTHLDRPQKFTVLKTVLNFKINNNYIQHQDGSRNKKTTPLCNRLRSAMSLRTTDGHLKKRWSGAEMQTL